jgi:hypothetical protein
MRLSIVTFALIFVLLLGVSSYADSITIGTRNGGNCLPFGCPGAWDLDIYQQGYSGDAFPTGDNPIWITSITFFDTYNETPTQGYVEPHAVWGANYTLSLSTTRDGETSPELSLIPSENIGSDNQVFFSGFVGGPLGGSELVIRGTPFYYDPTLGDLLLDVRVTGILSGQQANYFDADPSNWRMSRVFHRSTDGTGDVDLGGGLVTRLGYSLEAPKPPEPPTPVPEPSNLTLLAIGMAGVIGYGWRRNLG